MKFIINSRVLRSALESANKGINPQPTIPALANFLLEGDGLTLTITGSDANTTIKETLDCEAEGKALLPTNLLELVRTLNEGDVTIETTDTNATISWKNGYSIIPALAPRDYPEIASYDGQYLTIGNEAFLSALAHTIPHTTDDSIRPVLSGVLFNAKGSGLIDAVASDTHALGLYRISSNCNDTFDVIVPVNALKLVGGAVKTNDVEMAFNENNVFLRVGTTTITTRRIIGKFPKYESVIPVQFASTLTVEKAVILNSIKRVSTCSNKESRHLKLSLDTTRTIIETQDLAFGSTTKENLETASYDGAQLTIGFKGEYLIKCISAIESHKVKINFTDARHAAIITSDEDTSIALVMPMQI